MIDDRRAAIFYFIRTFLLSFAVLAGFRSLAQSVAGITHVPDTSYTTWSAYMSTRKTHPNIKIVQEFRSKTVAEKRHIPYCTIGERALLLDAFYPARQLCLSIVVLTECMQAGATI